MKNEYIHSGTDVDFMKATSDSISDLKYKALCIHGSDMQLLTECIRGTAIRSSIMENYGERKDFRIESAVYTYLIPIKN